jgi:HSP20 family protein
MIYRKKADLMPYDMVRTFNKLVDGLWPDEGGNNGFKWAPPVDICEKGDSISFKLELPGIQRDDIDIEVANGVLTVRGEKKIEESRDGETWHRREVTYGSFIRSFSLPADMKADEAEAAFKDGILTISIPKEEKALQRKIEIKG